MRFLIFLFCSFSTSLGLAQSYYKAESGNVKFFSNAPIENIEALTMKARAIFNGSSGEVAVLIPIKTFIFEKPLMQEHFNENYLESDKYMDASFKGRASEIPILKTGEQKDINVSGQLLIHGVPQHRTIRVTFIKHGDGSITATGKFSVNLVDHQIKIPSIVFQNIAEVVDITFDLTLKPVRQ